MNPSAAPLGSNGPIPIQTTNGRKPTVKMSGRADSLVHASALATQIDDLFELRSLIKRSQDAERKVTGQ
jgi:hypothetical protein